MSITEKRVNRDFVIQYFPNASRPGSKFIGVKDFVQILGEDIAERKIQSLYDKGLDEYTLKFRRGIKFIIKSR